MYWKLSFFIFFILSLKEKWFVNSLLDLNFMSSFMSCIIFLNFLFLFFFIFPFNSYNSKIEMKTLFNFIYFLVLFCFLQKSGFNFLVLLEMTVLPMTILILSLSKDKDKVSSVLFMTTLNLLGSVPFMMFCFKFDYLNLNSFFSVNSMFNSNSFFLMMCFLLVLISKIPVMMLHFWLTKAHVSASGPCSMILASLMLKLGTFGIIKFSLIFKNLSQFINLIVFSKSLISCVMFSFIMIRFLDMKNMIACSSILHMSTILPMCLDYSTLGVLSSMMMMVGHGLVSLMLFMFVTVFYENSFSRSMDLNKSMECVTKTSVMYFTIFIFLNMGVPPFITFICEMYICSAMLMKSTFYICIFITSMIFSVFYLMFFCTKTIFGSKISNHNSVGELSISFYSIMMLINTMMSILIL